MERNGTWRSRLKERVDDFVDRHVMVPDDPITYEVRGMGWPAGIRPEYMTLEELDEVVGDAVNNHWDAGLASLGNTAINDPSIEPSNPA